MEQQQHDSTVVTAGLAGSKVSIAGPLRTFALEMTVEQQDVLREPAKKRAWHAAKD